MGRLKAKCKVWVTGDFMLGEPWQDRQGKEHQSLRVTASHFKILSGGNPNNYNNNTNNTQATPTGDEEAPF
jgi:hypothetical protein